MSVFTPVPDAVLADWLEHYAIGRLVELKGISAGVQNSNFFVTTTLGRYVLTLFEGIPRAELPYYLHLMAHLARHGLPVPGPIANRDNEYLGTLEDRPAVLVMRLSGASEMNPTPEHCARVGAMLAGLHLAGQSYGRRQENPRGPAWRSATAGAVRGFLPADEQALLDAEIAFQAGVDMAALPTGAIHADLFRDNVLWDGEHIGGVIDFYFAGCTLWLYDLAVTVNDWCVEPASGEFDRPRAQALLNAYHAVRPLNELEHENWRTALRAAALRFWISRLYDLHLPRDAHTLTPHDPTRFELTLKQRQSEKVLPWPA